MLSLIDADHGAKTTVLISRLQELRMKEKEQCGLAEATAWRRRTQILKGHLEPLNQVLEIGGGSHSDIVSAFESAGIGVTGTKPKARGAKPLRVRSVKEAPKAVKNAKTKKVKGAEASDE